MSTRAIVALALSLCSFPAQAGPLDGTFRGRYTCDKGVTAATATFIIDQANRVRLYEVSYTAPGGPAIPANVIDYQGTYNPSTRTFYLPTIRWLVRPTGWRTGAVTGSVSADGRQVTYNWSGLGCTAFVGSRLNAR